MLTLVLGGARSGKSRYAQSLAGDARVVYIATARPGDDPEMSARIARHRATRPAAWRTVEEPLEVARAVRCARPEDALVIVDCVTVWLSNVLWEYRGLGDSLLQEKVLGIVDTLARCMRNRDVIAVSNEVGSGIVPEHAVGRLFRDLQGFANQQLAQAAERVVLLVAGLPVTLKDAGGTRRD